METNLIDANTALVATTLITTSGGIFTLLLKQGALHREIRSPNGISTGDAINDINKQIHKISREQERVAEELRKHIEGVSICSLYRGILRGRKPQ